MVKLQFAYPITLFNGHDGLVHMACRDLPEFTMCLPAETDIVRMLDAAEVVLDSVVDQYISHSRPLPHPSSREPGEYVLAPSAEMIVKAAKHQPEPPLLPSQFGSELER